MSDTSENPVENTEDKTAENAADNATHDAADDAPENTGAIGKPDDVRDEVKLDLDEGDLDKWEEVREHYVVDPDFDVTRPALTESEDEDE